MISRANNGVMPSTNLVNFDICQLQDQTRVKAEQAVSRIFTSVYGATINHYLPHLLTAQVNQDIAAVVGIRHASSDNLFLESYLPSPIEAIIKAKFSINTTRDNIVEIGNLVSTKSGISRQLFIVLAFVLAKANIEWVSFTATATVENILNKLSMQTLVVGSACQQALASGGEQWGSYYQTQPQVCVGNVFDAVTQLQKSAMIMKMITPLEPMISDLAAQLKQ